MISPLATFTTNRLPLRSNAGPSGNFNPIAKTSMDRRHMFYFPPTKIKPKVARLAANVLLATGKLLRVQRRKNAGDDVFAVFDLNQKTFSIDIPVFIIVDVHQNSGVILHAQSAVM